MRAALALATMTVTAGHVTFADTTVDASGQRQDPARNSALSTPHQSGARVAPAGFRSLSEWVRHEQRQHEQRQQQDELTAHELTAQREDATPLIQQSVAQPTQPDWEWIRQRELVQLIRTASPTQPDWAWIQQFERREAPARVRTVSTKQQ